MARTKEAHRVPLLDRLGVAMQPSHRTALEALAPLLEDLDELNQCADILARYAADITKIVLAQVVPYREA